MKKFIIFVMSISLLLGEAIAQTGKSNWISIGTNGKISYKPDARGNTIPDFSYCGYDNSNSAIPNVTVVKTITAISGDNRTSIQNAIKEVESRTPDANGFRGALLLKAGEYKVSGLITISKSGVVLKGEGNSTTGTRLIATATTQSNLIAFEGAGSPSEISGSRVKISDTYVPTGTKSFTLTNASSFKPGDLVAVLFSPKQNWIETLGMGSSVLGSEAWTTPEYNLNYYRKIVAVAGNKITIDIPLVQPIDAASADGYLYKYTWSSKIAQVGIENMRLSSTYKSVTDEAHGWKAITFDNLENAWAKDIIAQYFGYSCVSIGDKGMKVSVLNCQMLDPMSITTGGRKYSFDVNGQLNLVKNCYTRGGRHDYVTGSQTCGPNAFVSCKADNQQNDIGPHHRWATGVLFDNIVGNGEMNVENRKATGSGHGWSGAQTLYWNCTGTLFKVQSPPQHLNWAIGCKGTITDQGGWHKGNPGVWESINTFVAPQTLFDKQLQDRLNGAVNALPAASLLTPLNNASFNAPANVNITANASDADGSITKVEFFSGTILLGTDTSSPYSFAWNNVAAGTYNITAKATDNEGASVSTNTVVVNVTKPANQLPTITLTAPANNATFNAPANMNITANASDPDGTIAKVEFYNGATLLGTDTSSPYVYAWNNVTAGTYNITAKATDNEGGSVTTNVTVLNITNLANQLPTITLTGPANNSTFNAPANINITANANDADGSITKVEFFNGTTLLGSDTSTPYAFTWNNAAAGTYNITAKASDNKGAVTTSTMATVIVKSSLDTQAPTVSISSPANNITANAPANITITANASDNTGITKVEFYQGSTLLTTDSSSPYSFAWASVAAGKYSITAKAYDAAGNMTTSASVNVTVNSVTNNSCSSIPAYIENNKYIAGSKVQNAGRQYQCKPFPYSGWCNGAAWAYAPGTGAYWSDAWILVGSCTARTANDNESTTTNDVLLSNAPNPFQENTSIELRLEEAGAVSIKVYDKTGLLMATIIESNLGTGIHQFNFDAQSLTPGMYVLQCTTQQGSTTRKIMKAQ
jgi:hypothetical protein